MNKIDPGSSCQCGSATCHIFGRVNPSLERSTFAAPDILPKPHHPVITRHARRSDVPKSVGKFVVAYKHVSTQKIWEKTVTGATVHGLGRSGVPAGPKRAPRKWTFLPIWRVTRQKSYDRNSLAKTIFLSHQTLSGDNLTWIRPLLQNGA